MTRALLCFLAACTVSTSASEQPIIGGDADPNDTSVVFLVAYPQDRSTMFGCTATVIAPTALVTAAHCVDHVATYSYGVFWGTDATNMNLAALIPQLTPVVATHIHPSYDRNAPFNADIAIINLASAAPVAAVPFGRAAPTAGVPARIIGFGQAVGGTYNASRREATTTLAAIDSGDTITVGDAVKHTCVGDSGGPALVMIGGVEHVVGVNSYGPSGCTSPAHFRRTDLYATFIDQYAGTMPPPPMPPPDAGVPTGPDAGSASPSDDGGGCSAGGGGTGLAFALVMGFGIGRRRSRCTAASAGSRRRAPTSRA